MKENNLIPFSRIKEILSSLDESKIVQYEGSIGTQRSIMGSPYQTVNLRLIFTDEEQKNEKDEERD